MLDTILHVSEKEKNVYPYLHVDESIPSSVQISVNAILSNFSEESGGLVLKEDGYFKHGLMEGHANKTQSEFIGVLARKRRKEQVLAKLKEQLNDLQQQKENTDQNIQECLDIINGMHDEFEHIPNMNTLNELLEKLFSLNVRLQELQEKKRALEKNTLAAFDAYKSAERKMLSVCSLLPYRREEDSYDEVLNDMEEYRECLHSLSLACKQIESFQSQVHVQTETREQFLEEVDQLSFEESELKNSISSLQMQIKKIEEVLQNPETIEKAQKLKEIHLKQEQNQKALIDRNRQIGILQHDLQESDMRLAELKNQVSETEACLKKVQQYFEEEISLNILFDREDKTLDECAKLAIHNEEKQYMVKSSSEMVNSLSEAYQKNNSDISNYNPRFEVLFQSDEFTGSYERTRYIMTFVYGGQKLSLYAFLKELKLAIETQEELISQKDRELFEDILSQTISDKLTQRIQDSRNWVKEMSYLMKKMDTSMGLTFSLDWKPVDPETIDEMDIRELEKILIRDKELITAEDEERVAKHFKSIIRKEKEKLEMNNGVPNYLDLVRNALDYRKWYEFKMSYIRVNEGKKDLTNAAFNRFSGGEKAMAMYVPLFASVNAQYQKAKLSDHPRIIALDEAFAGVDEKNIASMFEMVEKLDFDYIMNSQALWGCYETVKQLRICELLRPLNSDCITVINYTWNGKEKVMDE